MKKNFVFLVFLLALLERTVFDFGPNIELVTLASLLSVFYLKRNISLFLTFLVLALSDLIIGNTGIFLFTWSGFLIPILLSANFLKKLNLNGIKKVGLATFSGIGMNLFFYAWTNFGVWAQSSWGMYPRNLSGLIASYINGLPFLKMSLTSTLFFVPLTFAILELAVALKGGEIYDRICRQYRKFNFRKLQL